MRTQRRNVDAASKCGRSVEWCNVAWCKQPTVADLVLERAEVNLADELWLDDCLSIQHRQELLQVTHNKLRLVVHNLHGARHIQKLVRRD